MTVVVNATGKTVVIFDGNVVVAALPPDPGIPLPLSAAGKVTVGGRAVDARRYVIPDDLTNIVPPGATVIVEPHLLGATVLALPGRTVVSPRPETPSDRIVAFGLILP